MPQSAHRMRVVILLRPTWLLLPSAGPARRRPFAQTSADEVSGMTGHWTAGPTPPAASLSPVPWPAHTSQRPTPSMRRQSRAHLDARLLANTSAMQGTRWVDLPRGVPCIEMEDVKRAHARCSGGLADTSAIAGRVRGSGRRQLPIFCPRSLEPICAKSAGMPTCADDALPRSPGGFSSGDGSECGIRHCERWLARGRG